MRYDLRIRCLARVWLDVAPMSATDASFRELRDTAQREDPELRAAVAMDAAAGQRAALASPTGLQLICPGESFDIAVVPVTSDQTGATEPVMDLATFADLARRLLLAISSLHPARQARRLALSQEGFLAIDEAARNALPQRLFHVPEPFQSRGMFEWDWRLATRVPRDLRGVTEQVNTIATLKRASGNLMRGATLAEPFDRVRLDLDLSTSHEETTPRLGREQIDAFFTAAVDWHAELWRQLEQLLQIGDR